MARTFRSLRNFNYRVWASGAASRAAREDWLYRAIQGRFTAAEQQQLATGVELLKRLVAP